MNRKLANQLLRKWEYYFERTYITKADFVSSVDPDLVEKTELLHQKKGICIYNGFWKVQNPTSPPNPSAKLILTHTGTLTPGQRVELLLAAVKELIEEDLISPKDIEIRFIGLNFFPNQLSRILNYSSVLTNSIITTNRVSKEEAIQFNFESDYLLSFTDENYAAIYGKTYNYIACQKEILLVPGDGSLLEDLISKYKLGLVVHDKNGLKKLIIEKVNQKLAGSLSTKLTFNQETNFFSRSKSSKYFCKIFKRFN